MDWRLTGCRYSFRKMPQADSCRWMVELGSTRRVKAKIGVFARISATRIGRSKFRPRAEEKPATAAVTGPECVSLKSHTRQAFRTIRPLEPSVLEACILWRRSGLNLDRPLHSSGVRP